MPDLNWENEDLRNALYEMVNWWLDKGIEGFRVDAISHIKKCDYDDMPNPDNLKYIQSFDKHMKQPGIENLLQDLKEHTFDKYDTFIIGEASGVNIDDIESLNMYKERKEKGYSHEEIMESIYIKGRDNAHTPMQWDDSKNAGFTNGEPWIKVNTNYKEINAEFQLNDENSIFNYYKKLIKIRKENSIVVHGDYKLILEENKDVFAYIRTLDSEKLLVICNFTENNTVFKCEDSIEIKNKELLISNYHVDINEKINNIELKPYESRVCKLSRY